MNRIARQSLKYWCLRRRERGLRRAWSGEAQRSVCHEGSAAAGERAEAGRRAPPALALLQRVRDALEHELRRLSLRRVEAARFSPLQEVAWKRRRRRLAVEGGARLRRLRVVRADGAVGDNEIRFEALQEAGRLRGVDGTVSVLGR